ncbi:MAG: hypothetical protein NSGCLCUN01_02816 [uncultured Clostridium sp.]
MNNNLIKEFNNDFNELNESNKQYVIAISQALLFAQIKSENQHLINKNSK